MAEWHLDELEQRLTQRGWSLVHESRPGYRWGISGSWEISRGDQRVVLDFEGANGGLGTETYPMERAYACHVRSNPSVSVYFGKKSSKVWPKELDAFIASLDDLGRASTTPASGGAH